MSVPKTEVAQVGDAHGPNVHGAALSSTSDQREWGVSQRLGMCLGGGLKSGGGGPKFEELRPPKTSIWAFSVPICTIRRGGAGIRKPGASRTGLGPAGSENRKSSSAASSGAVSSKSDKRGAACSSGPRGYVPVPPDRPSAEPRSSCPPRRTQVTDQVSLHALFQPRCRHRR